MALKNNKLRDAVVIAIAVGGAASGAVSAQDVPASGDTQGATNLDRIQVTGSRIDSGRYLQPKIDFTERASAVFEIAR